MAGNEGLTRIDPGSPVYQEVARLYQIAQELRPGGQDRWNGELYSRTDDKWGGLRNDGTLVLNGDRVLDHLTGGERSDDPGRQGQALATVLHESLHARTEKDAKNEPNALRAPESTGLDEGLTELATIEGYDDFVQRAGYQDAEKPNPEYAGAVHAASEVLNRASSSDADRNDLLNKTLDQPVAMRWDSIADNIVRNELGDTVPPDADHQQAARAHLVNQMAVGEWADVHQREKSGPLVAELTNEATNNAVAQIREHYQSAPDEPYPARTPNPAAELATQQAEQQRAVTPDRDQPVDLTKLPPPDASTQVANGQSPQPGDREAKQPTPTRQAQGAQPRTAQAASAEGLQPTPTQPTPTGTPAGTQPNTAQPASAGPTDRTSSQQGDPMRFLDNQAPAAHATRPGPALGNGSRGAGTPTGPAINHPTPTRTTTPDRGRD